MGTMKPVDSIMLALGAGAIAMAVAEWMGAVETRVDARAFLLIALVCVGRVLLRMKLRNAARQRQMMIDEIPKRPLGIVDDEK